MASTRKPSVAAFFACRLALIASTKLAIDTTRLPEDSTRAMMTATSDLRLKARHGAKKAAIAVAASILTTVYHMLRDGTCYQDLGPEYFTRRNPAKAAATLANRIRNLGYHVEIRAAA
jgi:hypothetical protein